MASGGNVALEEKVLAKASAFSFDSVSHFVPSLSVGIECSLAFRFSNSRFVCHHAFDPLGRSANFLFKSAMYRTRSSNSTFEHLERSSSNCGVPSLSFFLLLVSLLFLSVRDAIVLSYSRFASACNVQDDTTAIDER